MATPNRCRNHGSCGCTRGDRIVACNNAIGSRAVDNVPEARLTMPSDAGVNFGYAAANSEDDPLGLRFRRAVASMENVSLSDVLATGSLLELIPKLPRALGRRNVVQVEGDFPKYALAARDIPLTVVPVAIDAESVDTEAVARAVHGKEDAIVFLTFAVTNPLQQKMPVEAIEAVLSSNKTAIVVVDAAYSAFGENMKLAQEALSNDRTLYINTASKHLLLCGVRVGWAIAAEPVLERVAAEILPYPVSSASLEQASRMIEMPDVLRVLRQTQTEARGILGAGLRKLGLPMRAGAGPWVLLNLGAAADQTVKDLKDRYRIDVQPQKESLTGWIRISAGVPCEAETIVKAMTELLREKYRDR